jgi:hypothetical protein
MRRTLVVVGVLSLLSAFRQGKWVLLLPVATAILLSIVACHKSSPTGPTSNLFAIRTCKDVFRVRIDDAAVARQAADLVGKGNVKIVCGLV